MSLEKFLKTADLIDLLHEETTDTDVFSGKSLKDLAKLNNGTLEVIKKVTLYNVQLVEGLVEEMKELIVNSAAVKVTQELFEDLIAAQENGFINCTKSIWKLLQTLVKMGPALMVSWNSIYKYFQFYNTFFWRFENRRKKNISESNITIVSRYSKGILIVSLVYFSVTRTYNYNVYKNEHVITHSQKYTEKRSLTQAIVKNAFAKIPFATTNVQEYIDPRTWYYRFQDLFTVAKYGAGNHNEMTDFFEQCLFNMTNVFCRNEVINYLKEHENDIIDEETNEPFHKLLNPQLKVQLDNEEFYVPFAETFYELLTHEDADYGKSKIVMALPKWIVNRKKNPRKAWSILAGIALKAYDIDVDRNRGLKGIYAPQLYSNNKNEAVSELQKLIYKFVEIPPLFIDASATVRDLLYKFTYENNMSDIHKKTSLHEYVLNFNSHHLQKLQEYLIDETDPVVKKLIEWIKTKIKNLANKYSAEMAITLTIQNMTLLEKQELLKKTETISRPSLYRPFLGNLQDWLSEELKEKISSIKPIKVNLKISDYENEYYQLDDFLAKNEISWLSFTLNDVFKNLLLYDYYKESLETYSDSLANYQNYYTDFLVGPSIQVMTKIVPLSVFFSCLSGLVVSKSISTVAGIGLGLGAASILPNTLLSLGYYFTKLKPELWLSATSTLTDFFTVPGASTPATSSPGSAPNAPSSTPSALITTDLTLSSSLSTNLDSVNIAGNIIYYTGKIFSSIVTTRISELANTPGIVAKFYEIIDNISQDEIAKQALAIVAVEQAITVLDWWYKNPDYLQDKVVNGALARAVVYYLSKTRQEKITGIKISEDAKLVNSLTMAIYGLQGFDANYLNDYRFIFTAIGKQSEVISWGEENILTPILSYQQTFLEISIVLAVTRRIYNNIIKKDVLKLEIYLPRRSLQFKGTTNNSEILLIKLLQLMYSISHRSFALVHEWIKSKNYRANLFAGILTNMDFSTAHPLTYIDCSLSEEKLKQKLEKKDTIYSVNFRLDFFNDNEKYEEFMKELITPNNTAGINQILQKDFVLSKQSNQFHIGVLNNESNKNEVLIQISDQDSMSSQQSWPSQKKFDEILNEEISTTKFIKKKYTNNGNSFLVSPTSCSIDTFSNSSSVFGLTEKLIVDGVNHYAICGILTVEGCWSKIAAPDNFGVNQYSWYFFDNTDKLQKTQTKSPCGPPMKGVLIVLYSLESADIIEKHQIKDLFEKFVNATLVKLKSNEKTKNLVSISTSHIDGSIDLIYHNYDHPLCVITAFVLQTTTLTDKQQIGMEILTLRNLVKEKFSKQLKEIETKSVFETVDNKLYKLDQLKILEYLCEIKKVNLELVTYINTSDNLYSYHKNQDDSKVHYMGYVKPSLYWEDSHFIPMISKQLFLFAEIEEVSNWDFYLTKEEDTSFFSWFPYKSTPEFLKKIFKSRNQ
jgi:hypothetical protein